ncbi:MAG: trigger factor [Synergistaceae bacterium]|jgi:trigger factor|nr:trigger factor [Synergistaceae bacterium]
MKTELLGQEKNIVKVKVDFDAEEIAASLNEAIQALSLKVRVPGFRNGRVPRKVIEMRFGRDNLYKEALSQILTKAATQIAGDYDLEAIAPPSYNNASQIREGEPLSCELFFEVSPEVSLPELQDIEVEKLRVNVTDEMLHDTVEKFRKNLLELNPVERAAGEGDVVSMTSVVHILNPDGNVKETESPETYAVDLSASLTRAEVKDALLGKSKGDAASAEFVVEPDFQNQKLAGKRLRYDMTIKEVQEKVLPEMGPKFYKQMLDPQGDAVFETEDVFRAELTRRMAANLEGKFLAQAIDEAVSRIMDASGVEVSGTLLRQQIEFEWKRDDEELKKRLGMSLEEYLHKNSISPGQYMKDLLGKAESTVKRELVLEELAKKFEVEVTEEEISAELTTIAQVLNAEPMKIRSTYYRNEDLMTQLVSGLRHRKAAWALREKVRIKEVDELSRPAPTEAEGQAQVKEE